jgi:hypothetical protein
MGVRGQRELVRKCLVRSLSFLSFLGLPLARSHTISLHGDHETLQMSKQDQILTCVYCFCKNRGRIVHDRITKAPKLNCRNWECGVILPVRAGDDSSTVAVDGTTASNTRNLASSFGALVPVPMVHPAQGLEGKKPWTLFG